MNRHTFRAEQNAYLLARAAYEAARDAASAEINATPAAKYRRSAPEAEREAAWECMENIRAAHHVDELLVAKIDAERAMVRAELARVRAAFPQRAAELDGLTVESASKFPRVWDGLVDLCARHA